jgi:hypothetical protein
VPVVVDRARYNHGMNYDLEVNSLRIAIAKPATFEGVSIPLESDQFVAEEPSLLDAIIVALAPLTTLVRRQSDER